MNMKQNRPFILMILALAAVIGGAALYLLDGPGRGAPGGSEPVIAIGWQTAWSQQGQVIQALDRTNISQLVAGKYHLVGFLFGPDLNEAANSGSLSVTNAGIVPVVNLFAANPNWIIVGRQVDFDISIVARNDGGIHSVRDLAGKRFGVPIGGGSHPFAIQSLQLAGLTQGSGPNQVTIINVKPSEMPLALKSGQVDAIASWDPTTTLALKSGGIVIAHTRYVGFITVDKHFAEAHRDSVVHMLEGVGLAYWYAAQHKNQVDRWFSDASKINLALVTSLPTTESNLLAETSRNINIIPTNDALRLTQLVANEMLSLGLIRSRVSIFQRTDLSYAREAQAYLQAHSDLFDRTASLLH